MPFSFVAAAAPYIGAAAGGLTIANDLTGGSSGGQNPGGVYQPTGASSQDSNLQNLLSQNSNLLANNNPYNTYSPQIIQAFQQMFSNPQAGNFQTAANNAGQAYTGVGQNSAGLAQLLSGASPLALSAGANVANMGLDPRQARYQQALQQNTDQSNVNNAAYGLTGQQAAGNTNQANTNFNIDWQNQELSRALQGLTGLNQSIGTAGSNATTAQNVGTAGAAAIGQGGAVPYAAGNTIGQTQQTALQSLIANLLGPVNSSQGTINNLQSYLGEAVTAGGAGANANSTNSQTQQSQGAGISSLLGNLFGSTQTTPTGSNAQALPWQVPGYVNPGSSDIGSFGTSFGF